MWTQEFGLALLHAGRLCIELIPTFNHGKGFQTTAHDIREMRPASCLPGPRALEERHQSWILQPVTSTFACCEQFPNVLGS